MSTIKIEGVRNLKKSAQVHQGLALLRGRSGFTLVELLVVIAILAILATVLFLTLNPLEVAKRGRDAARLTDLASLRGAINLAVQEATGSSAEVLCTGVTAPCSGSSNTGTRASDGTGWVKVNLSAQDIASLPTLPIDQSNTTANHYTYCSDGDSWEINTALESQKESGKAENDGGDDTALYEVGSSLGLIKTSGGSCTY